MTDAEGQELRLGKQEMALLVYLVVEAGEPKGRDFLGDLLSSETRNPRGLVNQYLSKLRGKLPAGCIQGSDAPWVSGITCDAVLLNNAATNRTGSTWEVLQLYRGRFLDQFYPGKHASGFEKWASSTAQRLRQRMEILWHHEMNAALQTQGEWARVRKLGIWGLEVDSGWDVALVRLMEAEIALGDPDAAIVWADPFLDRLKKAKRPVPRQLSLMRELAEANRQAKYAAAPPHLSEMNSHGELHTLGHVDWSGGAASPVAESLTALRTLEWDLFLASPMDAFPSDDLYEGDQRTVSGLVAKLRTVPGLERIFYAGETRPTRSHFNDPSVSFRGNLKALRGSRTFVMIHPDRLPSSTIVEATFALAWGIPGVLFVRRRDDLPFLLRSVTDVFPTMLVRTFLDFDNLMEVLLEELSGLVGR